MPDDPGTSIPLRVLLPLALAALWMLVVAVVLYPWDWVKKMLQRGGR